MHTEKCLSANRMGGEFDCICGFQSPSPSPSLVIQQKTRIASALRHLQDEAKAIQEHCTSIWFTVYSVPDIQLENLATNLETELKKLQSVEAKLLELDMWLGHQRKIP